MASALVGIVGCRAVPELDEDWPLLREALAARGVVAEVVFWDDPEVRWEGYEHLVIRGTWDYTERPEEFRRWLAAVDDVATIWNPRALVEWNMDKRYLRDLAAAGIPIIPTTWIEPGDDVARIELPAGEIVVKPTISAGGRDSARYAERDHDRVVAHIRRLQDEQRAVMVQPYISSVDAEGELAVICFDGTFSHGVRKSALLELGEGVVDALHERTVLAPAEADDQQRALAAATIAAATGLAGGEALYARIDLLRAADGSPIVIEAELFEPALFLTYGDGSVDRFADAIVARCA